MSDTLYGGDVLALARAAHGAGRLPEPGASVVVHNPLCGDRVTLDLDVDGERVRALAHQVRGCALCEASASWLGLRAPGHDGAELRRAAAGLERLVRDGQGPLGPPFEELDLFAPVHAYRSRHRCVLLPFEALLEALDQLAG